MKSRLRVFQQYALACLSAAVCTLSPAIAAGLQIAPVSLTLQGTQNADGIWLSNAGDTPINAQVRVYRWTQSDNSDKLTYAQGLVISPPMLALAPGEKQLVRVIRTGLTTSNTEDTWRLSIDELSPVNREKNQIQFVMHYSVPVFIQPAGLSDATPKLQWKLVQADGKAFIEVNNQGNSHAQLAQANFVADSGARKIITPGLLGYVLPGSTIRWIIPVSASDAERGGKIEVMINGQKTVQNL
ncbi:molecular chaperone [Salmonella enterica]|uniref:Molecular chaperone n=1 Tax=Salmonella diarizonae TaxID=59204 RepID=A0A702DH18_SALDZ|nr:molecular chaperone [Salmonella enterica subsp. diarizonae]EGD1496443.1 molecular chaperone [Salmonella enterica]EHG3720518.1 molecular chaperone [Salmonella enterica subsp. diarizonae serovar 11:k:z53]EKR1692420.1 molecular chaperone [Salmonella enterica subsp. diarizonae serovar 6,7,14:k:z50]EHM6604163.1 molecular chaperone [Salmonella enterica]